MLKLFNIFYIEIIRMSYNGYISPDGKWKIIIEDNKVKWVELTQSTKQYTTQELVEATKNIAPELWK